MEYMKRKYLRSLSISDLILVVIILMIAFLTYRSYGREKNSLYIYKDSQLFGVYQLDTPQDIVVDDHVRIQIADGKARISHSDCPDKRCVKQGFNNNMPIICLPNHVVLEFKSREEDRKLILY
jgi:hypothetical protein